MVYWYEIIPVQSDALVFISLSIMKLAPFLMLIISGFGLAQVKCAVSNSPVTVNFVN